MSEEVYYTQFIFRVYASGRRERLTEIYLRGGDGQPELLTTPPRGQVAAQALEAVEAAGTEGLSSRRRVKI